MLNKKQYADYQAMIYECSPCSARITSHKLWRHPIF